MIEVDVRADFAAVVRQLGGLERQVVAPATADALNRVATTTRRVAIEKIVKDTGIRSSAVRQRINISRANRNKLEARIKAQPYSPNLVNYAARQTRAGVSANAWRARKVYRGTFLAPKKRLVFVRTGPKRLPIKAIRGPSVRKQFMRLPSERAMRDTIAARWPIEFERSVRFRLDRHMGRA
jgi:hypothetical protein